VIFKITLARAALAKKKIYSGHPSEGKLAGSVPPNKHI
jgi:hypothetical protein